MMNTSFLSVTLAPASKRLTHGLMALALAAGLATSPIDKAAAHEGEGIAFGVAAGLIGLGILGAAAHAERGYGYAGCHRGPEECGWSDRHCFYNRFGDYVCRGGSYRCWRPRDCD